MASPCNPDGIYAPRPPTPRPTELASFEGPALISLSDTASVSGVTPANPGVATDLILTLQSNEYLKVSRHSICDCQTTAAGAQEAARVYARIQFLEDEVERLRHQNQYLESHNRMLEHCCDEDRRELFGLHQENGRLQLEGQRLKAKIKHMKARYERDLNDQRSLLDKLSERLERLKVVESEKERLVSFERERDDLMSIVVKYMSREQALQTQIVYWKAKTEAAVANRESQDEGGLWSTLKGFLGA